MESKESKAEALREEALSLVRRKGCWLGGRDGSVWGYKGDEATVILHTRFAGRDAACRRLPVLVVNDHFGALVLRLVLTTDMQAVIRTHVLQDGPSAVSRAVAGDARGDHLRLARSVCEVEWLRLWGGRAVFFEGVQIPKRLVWSHLGYLPLVLAACEGLDIDLTPAEGEFLSCVRVRECWITDMDKFRVSLAAVLESSDVKVGEVWVDLRRGIAKASLMLGSDSLFIDLGFRIAASIPVGSFET